MKISLTLAEGNLKLELKATTDDEDVILDLLEHEKEAAVQLGADTGQRRRLQIFFDRGPKESVTS